MYTSGLLSVSEETHKMLQILATMNSWSPTMVQQLFCVFSHLVLPISTTSVLKAFPCSLNLSLYYILPSTRICLIEITETFKWNILNFLPTKLHIPFILIDSLLIPFYCNGRKVYSLESNPLPYLEVCLLIYSSFFTESSTFLSVGFSSYLKMEWSGPYVSTLMILSAIVPFAFPQVLKQTLLPPSS